MDGSAGPSHFEAERLSVDTDAACVPWAVAGDVCHYVKLPVCQDGTGLIPYLQLHYCWLSGRTPVTDTILLLWAAAMMAMLTVVVARFFRPALAEMVHFFSLSEDTAGASILSLSNGIPHLIKQLTSAETASRGVLAGTGAALVTASRGAAARAAAIPLAIAMPVATGILSTNATLAAVAFVSRACRRGGSPPVKPSHFMRDVAFYAAAVALTTLALHHGKVAVWPAVLLLALYFLYIYLFISCKCRPASSHRSTHSMHSLVGSYHSLQHALLTSTPTQHSSNLSTQHMCVSTSESSLHHSHASPRPHSPGRNGAVPAPAAAPAAAAAAAAAAEQPGIATPPRASGGGGMHMSVTLLAPPRTDGSSSLTQSTPRFGVPAHAAGLAAVLPTEATPSTLNAPALHALVAARDTLRGSFGRKDGVKWCPPSASLPPANAGSPAHDFDGAVGPSTQFIRDEGSARGLATRAGSASSAARSTRTMSRDLSRASRPRSMSGSNASSGSSLSPDESSGSDVIGLVPPPAAAAAILPGAATVVPGNLAGVPRSASRHPTAGDRPSAAAARVATAPDAYAPRAGDAPSAMEYVVTPDAGVCPLAADACDGTDSPGAVDTPTDGDAVLNLDSAPRAADGLQADASGVRVLHAVCAEDAGASHTDDGLRAEEDDPRAAPPASADDGMRAEHAQGTADTLHAEVSLQGEEDAPRAAHARFTVEGGRAPHSLPAARVPRAVDGPPAEGAVAAPDAVDVFHASAASLATDASHAEAAQRTALAPHAEPAKHACDDLRFEGHTPRSAHAPHAGESLPTANGGRAEEIVPQGANAPRAADGLHAAHSMCAVSTSHAAALLQPQSIAADLSQSVAAELLRVVAGNPRAEEAQNVTGTQYAGGSPLVTDLPIATGTPYAAHALGAEAAAPRADDADRAVHALRAGSAKPAAEVAHPVTSPHAAQDCPRDERAPLQNALQTMHAPDAPRAVHAPHAADAPHAALPPSAVAVAAPRAVAAEPTSGAHAPRAVDLPRAAHAPHAEEPPAAVEVSVATHAAGALRAAAAPSTVAAGAPRAASTRRAAPMRLPHNVAADSPHAVAADLLRMIAPRVVSAPPATGAPLADGATPAMAERSPRAAHASRAAIAQRSEAAPRAVAMRRSEAAPRAVAMRRSEAAPRSVAMRRSEVVPHDAHAPRIVDSRQDKHTLVAVDARCAVHALYAVPEHHVHDDPRAMRPPRLDAGPPATAATRAVQAPRVMTADLPHAVATGLPRAVASDLPHAAVAYLPRAMFVDLPHAVAADVPHSVAHPHSVAQPHLEDAQQTESARRAVEVPLAIDGDAPETAPRTDDAPRTEDAHRADDARRADDAPHAEESTPTMAVHAPRAEHGPHASGTLGAIASDAARTTHDTSATDVPPASAKPHLPNRAAAPGTRPVNTSNHTSRRHGGRRRRGRRGHAGRAVAEAAHADDDPALLPVVTLSETSVFQVTAAHGDQHNSTISVDLSSVRFPSCHTPVDGSSWCGGDLPSTQRESPPAGATGGSSAPGIARGALSLLADLPGRAWSYIEYPLATIARCFMPKLDAAVSDRRAPLFTSMLPVTIPLFLIVTQKLAFYPGALLSAATVLYGTACSLFSSVLLYTVYPPTGTADADRRVCFAVVALCMARLWMFLLAAETNHVFRALGRIHGGMFDGRPGSALATPAMPPAVAAIAAAAVEHGPGVLSATVYEWVEMAPDFVAIVGIASAGLTATAVAGCFGTPIFSMTVGTGVALLRELVKRGPETWDDTPVPWVAAAFAAVSAARHALLVPLLHRWRLTWAAAATMVLFYAVFEAAYIWVSV